MKKKLYLKGWSKEEIVRAEKIINKAEKNKHVNVKRVEKSLYWFVLIIGLLGTVMLSLILIPVLMVNMTYWGYVITGVFGFLLGALIVMIIKDLHWLEHHHHVFISLLIPTLAVFNFFIIVNKVNLLNFSIGLNNFNNPVFTSLIYLVCFLIPYAAFLLLKR